MPLNLISTNFKRCAHSERKGKGAYRKKRETNDVSEENVTQRTRKHANTPSKVVKNRYNMGTRCKSEDSE